MKIGVKFWIVLFLILGIGLCVILTNFQKNYIVNSEEDIINNCKEFKADVIKSSYCFKDNVKTFYNYTIVKEVEEGDGYIIYRNPRTFEEIIKSGGDCTDYSNLYFRIGKKLGFESEIIKDFEGRKYAGHQWAVLCDKENCCKLDLLEEVECEER